uniref:DM domain-containing protein n=1 Tax=Caenorhabditis japonica TaxID=281687 RepID=A0A8R1IM94_CAEJA
MFFIASALSPFSAISLPQRGRHVQCEWSEFAALRTEIVCSQAKSRYDAPHWERRPNCQRCAQHSVVNRLKGHKRACPFRDCFCAKCQVVVERQKLMADQIKLRRRQKREKNNLNSEREAPAHSMTPSPTGASTTPTISESSTSSSTPMCLKCAQQVIGYQQLLSILDPAAAADPMITLSAILAACPHKNE